MFGYLVKNLNQNPNPYSEASFTFGTDESATAFSPEGNILSEPATHFIGAGDSISEGSGITGGLTGGAG